MLWLSSSQSSFICYSLARQKICMFFCGSSATCSPNAALHFLGQCQQLGSERLSLCQTFCLEKCWFASQSKQFNKTCQIWPRPKSRGKCVVHTTYSNVDSSAKFWLKFNDSDFGLSTEAPDPNHGGHKKIKKSQFSRDCLKTEFIFSGHFLNFCNFYCVCGFFFTFRECL